MRRFLALCLAIGLATEAQSKDLKFRVEDADSGKPIENVKATRWASTWQPRILLPPGKFWFPNGGTLLTDDDGSVGFTKHDSDDWYHFEAEGYQEGRVKRLWFQYSLSSGSESKRRDLVEKAGQFIVPMKKRSPE